jgi:hypothetical protein
VLVAEAIVASITKAVAGYALSQGGQKIGNSLKRRPAQQAFKRALRKAIEQLNTRHPEWTSEPFFFAAASIKSSRPTFAILDWVSRLTADSWKVSFSSEPKIRLTLAPTMLMVG